VYFTSSKRKGDRQEPFPLLLVELRRSLIGRPFDDPIQPLMLVGSGQRGMALPVVIAVVTNVFTMLTLLG
jgi:hypothetical protein